MRTSSGCSFTASDTDEKMTPYFASVSFAVVMTLTLSKMASTATPASRFCSSSGMPSFSYVFRISASTSSRLSSSSFGFGAA